jgi:hypothetical protein
VLLLDAPFGALGPRVKVVLVTESGYTIHAEVSLERYRELELRPGRVVFVSVRDVRVFVDLEHAASAHPVQRPSGPVARPVPICGAAWLASSAETAVAADHLGLSRQRPHEESRLISSQT